MISDALSIGQIVGVMAGAGLVVGITIAVIGKEVATGEIGELIFSSPAVVAGYHNKVSFPGKKSWYYSGDLARKNKNGCYVFIERKSGMIKVAGLKVYPLQVELVIQEHPAIKEVAIIGVKENRRGFVPKAYIVTKAGKSGPS